MLKTVLIFAFLVSTCIADHNFNIENKCTYSVRIGILGTNTHDNITEPLAAGAKRTITVPAHWSGRLWGKTFCDANGKNCAQPNTLAEWTLSDHEGGQDFYDVSLVDGFNMPLRITPTAGTFKKGNNPNSKYDCASAGCDDDLLAHCPKELAVMRNGTAIACKSACAALKTEQYCCKQPKPTPQNCYEVDHPKDPATNPYPAMFKKACPTAYSYAYDDATSTFTCHGAPQTSYDIVFCSHL